MFNALPAMCYFAYCLKKDFPNANIVLIINSDIKEQIQKGLQEIADYYGLKAVMLKNIDKEGEHPTKKGMVQISEQVINAI